MSLERAVVAVAGVLIIVSLALAYLVSPYWLALTLVVGINLSQSAFTGYCPIAYVLKQLGLESGRASG